MLDYSYCPGYSPIVFSIEGHEDGYLHAGVWFSYCVFPHAYLLSHA